MGPVPGTAIAVAAVQFHLDGVARTARDVDVPEVDSPVPAVLFVISFITSQSSSIDWASGDDTSQTTTRPSIPIDARSTI